VLFRSHTVTAAWLPDGLEWPAFNAAMRARGLVVAGGQGKWTGKILRVGHMGDVGADEIADAVRVMGEVLTDLGLETDAAGASDAVRRAAARDARAASMPGRAAEVVGTPGA
jgi:aspartate aminotransferase-like enzyme